MGVNGKDRGTKIFGGVRSLSKIFLPNDVTILVGSGAPTNGGAGTGAGVAGKGSQYIDYTNGVLYLNTNTKASPTWTSPAGSVSSPDGVTLDANGAGSTLEVKPNGVGAASLALYAENGLTPGPAVALEFTVADHATQNVDFVIAKKMVVTSAHVVATSTNGSNANTVQLDNGTGGNHITDAMSTNGLSNGGVVRAATIDPTYWTIAAAATLRIVQTKAGGTHSFKVCLFGYLVA